MMRKGSGRSGGSFYLSQKFSFFENQGVSGGKGGSKEAEQKSQEQTVHLQRLGGRKAASNVNLWPYVRFRYDQMMILSLPWGADPELIRGR